MNNSIRTETAYHENGSIRAIVQYRGDSVHGVTRTWHENGQIESEVPVVDSKMHGVSSHWSTSGELLGTNVMHHGTGVFRHWHDNGMLKSEIWLSSEIPNGWQRCWSEKGELEVETYFSQGRMIKRKSLIASTIKENKLEASKDFRNSRIDSALLHEDCERTDAREWLNNGVDRRLGENFTVVDSANLVKQLYQLGAANVEVIFLEQGDGNCDFADILLVELPINEEQRRKIFSIKSDAEKLLGYEVEYDDGQRFLFMSFF